MVSTEKLDQMLEERQKERERLGTLLRQIATVVFTYALPIAMVVFVIYLQNPNVGETFSHAISAVFARPTPLAQVLAPVSTPGIISATAAPENASNATAAPTYFPEISATPSPTPGPTVTPSAATVVPIPTPVCDELNVSDYFAVQCTDAGGVVTSRKDDRGCDLPPICVSPTPTVATPTPVPTPTPEPDLANVTFWLTEKQNYNRTGGQSWRLPKYYVKKAWEFATNGSIYSSPAVANGIVYFGSDDGYFYALNTTTGKEVWKYNVSEKVRAPPVVDQGVAIVGNNKGRLMAFDAANGSFKWQFQAGGAFLGSATIFAKLAWTGSSDYHLYSFFVENGTRYLDNFTDKAVVSSPAVTEYYLMYYDTASNLVVVNKTNGVANWTFKTDNGTVSPSGKASPITYYEYSPEGITTHNFIAAGDDGQIYHFYENGTLRWQFDSFAPIKSTPVLLDQKLYFANVRGDFYSFNISQKFNVTVFNSTQGARYIVNTTWVYNNTFLWKKFTGVPVEAGISVSDGAIYAASTDGALYIMHADSGLVLSSFKTGGPIFAAPSLADGFVFLASTDGKLYALSRP